MPAADLTPLRTSSMSAGTARLSTTLPPQYWNIQRSTGKNVPSVGLVQKRRVFLSDVGWLRPLVYSVAHVSMHTSRAFPPLS